MISSELCLMKYSLTCRYPSSNNTPAVTPTASSTTPLLYQEYNVRSQNNSPYLSIAMSPVRRSSTSDILSKKPSPSDTKAPSQKSSQYLTGSSGSGSALIGPKEDHLTVAAANAARRPSTSEMLRKARQKGKSDGKSVGHTRAQSLSQGGTRNATRNRRLSMAY